MGIGTSSTFVSSYFLAGAGLAGAATGLLVCLAGAAVVLAAGLLGAVVVFAGALDCTAGFVCYVFCIRRSFRIVDRILFFN